MSREQREQVVEEVNVFKLEYPEYNDEYISDYLACCDDYTPDMRDLFCDLLGY